MDRARAREGKREDEGGHKDEAKSSLYGLHEIKKVAQINPRKVY